LLSDAFGPKDHEGLIQHFVLLSHPLELALILFLAALVNLRAPPVSASVNRHNAHLGGMQQDQAGLPAKRHEIEALQQSSRCSQHRSPSIRNQH
jgi:hypothetical protein